jgi:tRNA pseudouridine55 synthase
VDGLIIIDKPKGPTSHDVVYRVRSLLAGEKTGHCGTLDPDATGLLLVTVGKATRFFPFLSAHDKAYEGTIRLGFATDTYDASGRPTTPECREYPEKKAILEAMKTFEGRLSQYPPPYSARKQNGRPLYELARLNQDVVLEPREVVIGRFSLGTYAPPEAEFEAECSAGTYVRSLAHDLGRTLGCGAHLTRLRRTASGSFRLRDASSLDDVRTMALAGRWEEILHPMESLLTEFPALSVGAEGAVRARHGNLILPSHVLETAAGTFPPRSDSSRAFRLLDENGRLLALARRSPEGEGLSPFLVVAD